MIDKKIEDIIFKTLDQAGYITTSNDKIVKNGIKRVIHLLEDFLKAITYDVIIISIGLAVQKRLETE